MDALELVRQGKIKRYFRATRKLNVPDMVYHITQRAAGKEPLFLEDNDYLFMIGVLKEISQNHSLRMYAFCLMPNHIHLLFSPQEDNLYDAMRDLFSRYAMRFNLKYERKGHLFGGPYRQAVCLEDGYLLSASLYIHLNPVNAALVLDPIRYRWSSSRLYCKDAGPKSFVDPDLILRLLSEDQIESKKKYRLLLKQGSELAVAHVLEQEDAIECFSSKLASIFPSIFRKVNNRKQVVKSFELGLLDMEELERKIQDMKEGRSYNALESRKAKKYLIEQLIARGYKRAEIAERLGLSRKTVYNMLRSDL